MKKAILKTDVAAKVTNKALTIDVVRGWAVGRSIDSYFPNAGPFRPAIQAAAESVTQKYAEDPASFDTLIQVFGQWGCISPEFRILHYNIKEQKEKKPDSKNKQNSKPKEIEKPYKCTVPGCTSAFTRPATLAEHTRIIHRNREA